MSVITIFQCAIVTEWDGRLEALAEIAERERWTYLRLPSEKPLPILDSYVRLTFQRAVVQDKLAEAAGAACFNTGLLTPNHEQLFGYFVRSDYFDDTRPPGPNNKAWFLRGFVKESDRWLADFERLPSSVAYWQDPADLIFDPDRDVAKNVDHIIVENLERFPVEYGGKLGDDGVPQQWTEASEEARESERADANVESDQDIESQTTVDPNVLFRLRMILDGAIEHSIRLARRNYRVAIPQFHRGDLQLLLPLYLRTRASPDLALTLQRHGDRYHAATVLYPDWAYRHARLLARPNSEWLGGFLREANE